jgi:poly(3-hydroxybutyrate) depolymerase
MTSENHEIIDTLAGMRKTAEEAREALDAVSADLGEQGRPEGIDDAATLRDLAARLVGEYEELYRLLDAEE